MLQIYRIFAKCAHISKPRAGRSLNYPTRRIFGGKTKKCIHQNLRRIIVKKVNLLSLLVVSALLLALVPAMNVHAQKEVKISAWTADQLYVDYFKTRTAEFEKAHSDLKITWDFVVKPDAPAAVLQALAAGEPIPDMVSMERKQFNNYMKADILEKNF